MNFVDVATLANAAGVSRQALEKVLTRGSKRGYFLWHGFPLEVRTFHGRGGRSGIQYQVKVSSLPPILQDRLKAHLTTLEDVSRFRLGDDQARFERAWKYEVIKPALEHPKGSAGRKAAIEALQDISRLDWTGHQRRLTRSTLYSWIDTYEIEGIYGLAQKKRADRGQRRVIISKAWSDAVPLDDATKAAIEQDLKTYVRSLVKKGTTLKIVQTLASEHLKKLTFARKRLADLSGLDQAAFAVPRTFVDEEHAFKAVYRHNFDRKASEDAKPRIRRTIDGLQPMEVVVMDVHHLNIHVAREDGTYSTPKLLAFYDVATARSFCEIIQFDSRGGVRNADVIQAFVNMCEHPAFGVPQFLYADNGSEYRFADMLEDALQLGSQIVAFDGRQERNRVIRARAYNAAAKHVEGWFRQLNQQFARHIPGWRDDDPMNPKRPQLGKLHPPYPRGFDAFCEDIFGIIKAYENTPQKGALDGTSPNLAFKSYVNAGWKATLLDPQDLLTVFTTPETRVVEKHGISVKGRSWTCDGLATYFGRTVTAHVPKFHSFGALLVTDDRGNTIGYATADEAYHVLDPRGAQESARRNKVRSKALRHLDKSVPDIDVAAELIAFGRNAEPVVPNPPDAVISIKRPGADQLALAPVPVDKTSRLHREEEIRRANSQALALFNQAFSTGGKR